MLPVPDFALGDQIELRKPHACGGTLWQVARLGADIGLTCVTCRHRIMLARRDLERRLRSRVATGTALTEHRETTVADESDGPV